MDQVLVLNTIISRAFGVIALAIGIINTFWGNDPGFGIFIILLSLVFLLPFNTMAKQLFNFSLPKLAVVRILIGAFIIWAAVGVGELFGKIELMRNSF